MKQKVLTYSNAIVEIKCSMNFKKFVEILDKNAPLEKLSKTKKN